jgi:hypothetical protein
MFDSFNEWQVSVLRHQWAIWASNDKSQKHLQIWCPFLGMYIKASDAAVLHIIPSSIPCHHLPYQLGYEADKAAGVELIRSPLNGIIMTSALHEEFRNGGFVILPIETQEGAPQRWRFKLLNWGRAGVRVGNSQYSFGTLEDKELKFKEGAGRPGFKGLYWHYAMSILRANKRNMDAKLPGLVVEWELRENPKHYHHHVPDLRDIGNATPPVWYRQGKYLRKSMMDAMISLLGYGRLKEADFAEGTWEGRGPSDAVFDGEVALHLAVFMERDWAADDESDDDLSGSSAETRTEVLSIKGLSYEMPQEGEGGTPCPSSLISDTDHSA